MLEFVAWAEPLLGSGVTLSIELLPTRHVSLMEFIRGLEKELPRNFAYTLDLEFAAFQNVLEPLLTHAKRFSNVHVKDYDGKMVDNEGKRRYCKLGSGRLDFDRIFQSLSSGGYSGLYTVEVPAASLGEAQASVDFVRERLRGLNRPHAYLTCSFRVSQVESKSSPLWLVAVTGVAFSAIVFSRYSDQRLLVRQGARIEINCSKSTMTPRMDTISGRAAHGLVWDGFTHRRMWSTQSPTPSPGTRDERTILVCEKPDGDRRLLLQAGLGLILLGLVVVCALLVAVTRPTSPMSKGLD